MADVARLPPPAVDVVPINTNAPGPTGAPDPGRDVDSGRQLGFARSVRQSLPWLERLDEWSTYPPDWDSYGAALLSPVALGKARWLLLFAAMAAAAQHDDALLPDFVAPLPTGGVQIEWRTPERRLEVEVAPSGNLHGLVVHLIGDDRRYETVPLASAETLVRSLTSLLGLAK